MGEEAWAADEAFDPAAWESSSSSVKIYDGGYGVHDDLLGLEDELGDDHRVLPRYLACSLAKKRWIN